MAPVRIGILGLGSMGLQHAAYIAAGKVEGATLTALCTRSPERLAEAAAKYPNAAAFTSLPQLLGSTTCDALLIATPHDDHPHAIRAAFDANLHVLVEKPLAVTIGAARQIVADYARYPHLKFGIMYNQRTNALHQKIREFLQHNALGKITRITWIITHWFRTDAYYASSPWRATWKGEGGGVLINQSIHNLDMLHWITGQMPARITAIATLGKFHPIEVEDDVTAILEYPDGMTAHFITTTGEHPGSNRLEIAGTKGRLLAENNVLIFTQNLTDSADFSRTNPVPFATPDSNTTTIPFLPSLNEHQRLTQNFVDAIRHNLPNEQLLAPGTDGPYALELANAILLAGLTRSPVPLPLEGKNYDAFLARMIQP
jgi:predicted dehydrogenase